MGQGGALCSCPPEQPVASCRPFWNGPPRRAHQTLGIRGVGGGGRHSPWGPELCRGRVLRTQCWALGAQPAHPRLPGTHCPP